MGLSDESQWHVITRPVGRTFGIKRSLRAFTYKVILTKVPTLALAPFGAVHAGRDTHLLFTRSGRSLNASWEVFSALVLCAMIESALRRLHNYIRE